MIDPIAFGAAYDEAGVGGVDFPELGLAAVWFKGISAPVDEDAEISREPATYVALAEETGIATVAAAGSAGLQARIIFQGVWDVVFIDAFNDIAVPTPPCALVLEVYEEDGETIAWEVGSAPSHPNPFLCLPENYGEQELDIIGGAATIGQVEVMVIDKAQDAGDQDSGWMTERLSADGITAVQGRRCRLLRYIGAEFGYIAIVDGPAGAPSLDSSFAAFRWGIRDTRDTERKLRAFERAETWVLPVGHETGWGAWIDPNDDPQWLIPPTAPLTGEYTEFRITQGVVTLDDYYVEAWVDNHPSDLDHLTSDAPQLEDAIADLLLSEVELLNAGLPSGWEKVAWHTWPQVELLWRDEGSSDPWTVIKPEGAFFLGGSTQAQTIAKRLATYSTETGLRIHEYELPDGSLIHAAYEIMLRFADENSTWTQAEGFQGQLQAGNFPTEGQRVEIAVRYVGKPTEDTPLYLEYDDDGETRLTSGRLLQKLYAGEYSARDADGNVVPTGIRYDAAALTAMTDLVLARITEPIDDLRDWAESQVYAPSGWIPALDNELKISPVSQVMPEDTDALPEITDSITEPVPDWTAGELIVNRLALTYRRYYPLASATDGVGVRDVTYEFQDPVSISLNGEQAAEYETDVFGSIGDNYGGAVIADIEEPGYQLAQDRKLYVFNRYQYGAQAVRVPVIRTLHLTTPEITQISSLLRAGGWVRLTLSWLPDYGFQRRGTTMLAQIIAIADNDCAWRTLTIEEVLPLARPS
jgi:hypothetical protein